MSAPITDFSTAVNQVRGLIPDIEILRNPTDPTLPPEYLFTDAHLTAFLDLFEGNVFLAAAQAVDTLASSEALIAKVMQSDDLKTDGSKTAQALQRHATGLRSQAGQISGETLHIIPPYNPCYTPELAHRVGLWWPDL